MARVFNFSAGPSMLPEPVLVKAAAEMTDYQGSGQSVMEMSHRSNVYEQILSDAEALLRELMQIPANYKVLFLQGGASSQFAMVPLNLFRTTKKADFVDTGTWSLKAIAEAKRFGTARVVATSKDKGYSYIPTLSGDLFESDADYVHITTNNTIEGTLFTTLPQTGSVPLVADMSSNILSQSYDVKKFGLIYAGAQKNIGPAGLTVVIIREDLIGNALDCTPTMFNYKIHADNGSMYNTPPCYAIYIAKLVFEWIKEQGGAAAVAAVNKRKAGLLYNYIDQSKFFKSPVEPTYRSLMNIPFTLPSTELDSAFLKGADQCGLVNLKGHRSVGGMRASIYNAMPEAGVAKLVDYMRKFETENLK